MRYLVFIFFFLSFKLIGQNESLSSFDILDHSIHLPRNVGEWRYKQALGFSVIYLPKDWLESALSLPMMYYKGNFALKHGLALHTEIKSIIVANDFGVGVSYNRAITQNLFIGAGYQFSYGLGLLYDLGYDNTLKNTSHRPYMKLGYDFRHYTVTLRAGIDYTGKIQFEAGDNNLTTNTDFLNGYNLAVYLEQRMFKNKSFSMGFSNSLLKFHILGWPAFVYTKRTYYIPEFNALFNF